MPDHEVQNAGGEVALCEALVVLTSVSVAMETGSPENHWSTAWATGSRFAHQSAASENSCSPPWPDMMPHLCIGAVFK